MVTECALAELIPQLAGRDSIAIPEDVEQLIEFVYGEKTKWPPGWSGVIRSY